jgi:hypothetical protein
MAPPTELVASMILLGVAPDGTEQTFVAGVGTPTQQPTGDWACSTTIDGLEMQLIYGEDSLQALCLGLSLIRARLEHFLVTGGRLFLDEGRDEISRDDLASWFSRVGSGTAG